MWQVEGSSLSQQAPFLPPSVSQKAQLDFQLSDLLVSLSDIGWVARYDVRYHNTFTPLEEGASPLLPSAPGPPPLQSFFFFI